MGNVLRIAHRPAIGVPKQASVREAARTMVDNRIGAVLVYDGEAPAGIFSERDVMGRVLLHGKDADATRVADVMSAPLLTFPASGDAKAAMGLMLEKHIRHLPVVGDDGAVLGMLSIRHLMQDQIDELNDEVDALDAYAGYDGATG
ncbi:MAG TPA: CBS domain-containing protein [Thermoanaerobaculia bacterium]|nr:CBS domain-containing protein [Thermoanaerobaculia bacterium]